MRVSFTCLALAFTSAAAGARPDDDSVKLHFKSDFYTVTWGEAPTPGRATSTGICQPDPRGRDAASTTWMHDRDAGDAGQSAPSSLVPDRDGVARGVDCELRPERAVSGRDLEFGNRHASDASGLPTGLSGTT